MSDHAVELVVDIVPVMSQWSVSIQNHDQSMIELTQKTNTPKGNQAFYIWGFTLIWDHMGENMLDTPILKRLNGLKTMIFH
jgi:hypothetical protein